MVVPPKHLKMVIFSRKTHGCWVPPFSETPIYSSTHLYVICLYTSKCSILHSAFSYCFGIYTCDLGLIYYSYHLASIVQSSEGVWKNHWGFNFTFSVNLYYVRLGDVKKWPEKNTWLKEVKITIWRLVESLAADAEFKYDTCNCQSLAYPPED